MTYAIQKLSGFGRWSSEGLGEATGWPSKREAQRALRSLKNLARSDPAWCGVYRIVKEISGEEISSILIESPRS